MAPPGVDGLSVMIQCWRDTESGETRLRVERIDRREEINLSDGTFLVRIAIDSGRLMERCLIRHIASGREAYVQGGPGLSGFIRDSLLADTGDPTPTERERT